MKLGQVELKYFRQYHEEKIEFPEGVIGVVGANGAGKSTLVEAISFALFGVKAIRGKLEDLKTINAPKKASLEVALSFNHNSQNYRVVRGITNAEIYLGGEAESWCTGTKEVNLALENVLGMSYEEFSATYLTEQKSLEFLSAQKGAVERERFIVRMMGYDKLERLQELLRGERRDKRGLAEGLSRGFEEEAVVQERIAKEQLLVKELTEKHMLAEKVIEDHGKQTADLKIKLQRVEKEYETERGKKEREQEGLRLEVHDTKKQLQQIEKRTAQFFTIGKEPACPTCEQPLGAKFLQLKESYEAERDQLQKKLAELTEPKAEQSSAIESEHQKLKTAYQAGEATMHLARLQRVKVEGELNAAVALLKRSQESLESFAKRKDEIAVLKKELQIIDEGDLLLTEFRRYLNAELRPQLALLASEYIAELTDGRYSVVDIASDFTPSVVDDGERKSVISGGEQDILNLCVRLALSTMLAERAGHTLSLIMLDEVFSSLDAERRANVLQLLDKLKARFDQIIIITHLEDVRDAVDMVVEVDYDQVEGVTSANIG